MAIAPTDLAENLGTTVLAVGALGTAAFGVVDGLKLFPWIDLSGFGRIFSRRARRGAGPAATSSGVTLDGLLPVLEMAYGRGALELLQAQYRNGRTSGDLPRTLRQGVRIGFGLMQTEQVAKALTAIGIPDSAASAGAEALAAERDAAQPIARDQAGEEGSAIARIETALDARIEASLALASLDYATSMKLYATGVALVIALAVNYFLEGDQTTAFIVGLSAVPLAPVAKDLASGIQEAVRAMKSR